MGGEIFFLLGVSVIIFGAYFLYKFRNKISSIFEKIHLPILFLSVLSAIPFMIIEESINCIDHGDGNGCTMTGWINVVLLIEIFILSLIVRRKNIQEIKKPLLYYSMFGILWESIAGGLRGLVLGLNPFYLFMAPYVGISYVFLAIIPLTLVVRWNKRKNKF